MLTNAPLLVHKYPLKGRVGGAGRDPVPSAARTSAKFSPM